MLLHIVRHAHGLMDHCTIMYRLYRTCFAQKPHKPSPRTSPVRQKHTSEASPNEAVPSGPLRAVVGRSSKGWSGWLQPTVGLQMRSCYVMLISYDFMFGPKCIWQGTATYLQWPLTNFRSWPKSKLSSWTHWSFSWCSMAQSHRSD